MSPLVLTAKSLLSRKFTTFLTVFSLTLGVTLLLGVERLQREARTGFTNTISNTDLIVGARTGNVSLLLSTVFRIGHATQNVSWETYQSIAENPRVAWTIPISLGDSHRGYRVLGTTEAYFTHYRYGERRALEVETGDAFTDPFDAVLGSEVARVLGYEPGHELVLAHGSGEASFVEHSEQPFRVSGILQATGTPVDQTVHVSLEGIAAIHEGWDPHHDHDHAEHDHAEHDHAEHDHAEHDHAEHDHAEHDHAEHDDDEEGGIVHDEVDRLDESLAEAAEAAATQGSGLDRLAAIEAALAGEEAGEEYQAPAEITAFLVGMKSRADSVMLQRALNTSDREPLTAIIPGVALQELWQVVGVVEKTLKLISVFVILVSLAGMLSVLMTSLNERRREMAILRSVGARPVHIVSLVAGEALAVTVVAIGAGLALLYGLLAFARPLVLEALGVRLELALLSGNEVFLLGTVLAVALLVGLIPAWRCYRNSLADGLTVRV